MRIRSMLLWTAGAWGLNVGVHVLWGGQTSTSPWPSSVIVGAGAFVALVLSIRRLPSEPIRQRGVISLLLALFTVPVVAVALALVAGPLVLFTPLVAAIAVPVAADCAFGLPLSLRAIALGEMFAAVAALATALLSVCAEMLGYAPSLPVFEVAIAGSAGVVHARAGILAAPATLPTSGQES